MVVKKGSFIKKGNSKIYTFLGGTPPNCQFSRFSAVNLFEMALFSLKIGVFQCVYRGKPSFLTKLAEMGPGPLFGGQNDPFLEPKMPIFGGPK